MGVLKPNTEIVPDGVNTSCDIVWLGVGVTWNTPCFDLLPPNVATKLSVKRSKSSGATYTCVVSYCGPTASVGVAAGMTGGFANETGAATKPATIVRPSNADRIVLMTGFPCFSACFQILQ